MIITDFLLILLRPASWQDASKTSLLLLLLQTIWENCIERIQGPSSEFWAAQVCPGLIAFTHLGARLPPELVSLTFDLDVFACTGLWMGWVRKWPCVWIRSLASWAPEHHQIVHCHGTMAAQACPTYAPLLHLCIRSCSLVGSIRIWTGHPTPARLDHVAQATTSQGALLFTIITPR